MNVENNNRTKCLWFYIPLFSPLLAAQFYSRYSAAFLHIPRNADCVSNRAAMDCVPLMCRSTHRVWGIFSYIRGNIQCDHLPWGSKFNYNFQVNSLAPFYEDIKKGFLWQLEDIWTRKVKYPFFIYLLKQPSSLGWHEYNQIFFFKRQINSRDILFTAFGWSDFLLWLPAQRPTVPHV